MKEAKNELLRIQRQMASVRACKNALVSESQEVDVIDTTNASISGTEPEMRGAMDEDNCETEREDKTCVDNKVIVDRGNRDFNPSCTYLVTA